MLNAGGFLTNMMGQPDSKLRSLTDAEFEGLARKYFNNIGWLKFCVSRWLQRSGR